MTAIKQYWDSNVVDCPHCGKTVERLRSNQKTCFSVECQTKQNREMALVRSGAIQSGEYPRKKRGAVFVDTKCPRCGKLWKIEIDRPTSLKLRRDYCPSCMDLICLQDNSMGAIAS